VKTYIKNYIAVKRSKMTLEQVCYLLKAYRTYLYMSRGLNGKEAYLDEAIDIYNQLTNAGIKIKREHRLNDATTTMGGLL